METSVQPLTNDFDLTWLHEEGDDPGTLRNQLTKLFTPTSDGWVWYLDDNTIIHPDFSRLATYAITNNPTGIIMFQQANADDSLRIDKPVLRQDQFDSGQLLVHASYLGDDTLWPTYMSKSFTDFAFASKLLAKGASISTIVAPASYYNYLGL